MNTEHIATPAERALADFRRDLRATKGDTLDLLTTETQILERLKALGAEMMAEAMKRADVEAPEVTINGARWGNRRVSRGTYQTIFGPLVLDRSVYQQSGRGRLAVPMDLRLGIVEGAYTPKMARVLTRGLAVMTEEEAAGFVAEVGLATASSSTFNRLPRAMAARYETKRALVEADLRQADTIPEGAATVQVGIDGVMVPQDGQHAKPRGRKTKAPAPPRYERRYGPVGAGAPAADDGHEGRAWHEAAVATMAFLDAKGERLKTTYIGRMPEPGKATAVAMLKAELVDVLRERPDLNVVFASDGAASHWAALEGIKASLPKGFTGHTMELVDAFHVAEYVQKAAAAVEGTETREARLLSANWRETLKEDAGASTVLRSMRARVGEASGKTAAEDLAAAITYIANQNDAGRMEYAEAMRRHYPIGTGITEAAAKTLVGVRMKRAGARFSQHGGQTVLTFRAALLSDRFEALHDHLHADYAAAVRLAA